MSVSPVRQAPATWKLIVAFGLVYLIWGSTYLAIRLAVTTIPPYLMAALRYLIAGGIMFVVARLSGVPFPRRVEWRTALIIGTLLLMGGNGGVSFAEQKLPSGLAALLVATVPLWMGLIEWFRPGGAYPGWRAILGLVIGFAGVIVLVGPAELLSGSGGDLLSLGVILLAAISWATGSVYSHSSHAQLPESPIMATAVEMLCGGAMLVLMASVTGEIGSVKWQAISAQSLLAVAYLVVFGSIVAFTCYVWILKVSTPARASTYAYVNPVVAVVLGWLVLGEQLTREMLIATPMIVGAVILITTSTGRRREAPLAELQVEQAIVGAEE